MFILISEQETHRGTSIIIDHSGRRRRNKDRKTFEFGGEVKTWFGLGFWEEEQVWGKCKREENRGFPSLPSEFE